MTQPRNNPCVAVIDVGSNTIKLLVATQGDQFEVLDTVSLESRISAGISKSNPELSETGIKTGLASIVSLVERAAPFKPDGMAIAATSAVREACNRDRFIQSIKDETGLELRVLSGVEEAQYIGKGAALDPALKGVKAFTLADLGGGSLELIDYGYGSIKQAASLPLGAVRLMERFIENIDAPLDPETQNRISQATESELDESPFKLPSGGTLVGAGGAVTYTRLLLADKAGIEFDDSSPVIALDALAELTDEIAGMSLEERKQIKSLPPARADIFPVALIVLKTLAQKAQAGAFVHTFYNLRYGLATELLTQLAQER